MRKIAFDRMVFAFAAFTCLVVSNANAEENKLEMTGNLDFYYQVSPQAHRASVGNLSGPPVLEGRFFDRNSNEYTLNLAEVVIKKKSDKVSFRIDLAAGELVDQMSGGGSQSVTNTNPTNRAANEPTRNVPQAILSYDATDRLGFTVGKFYTHIGFEAVHTKENWNYSGGYLFAYGPLWHEGLQINYKLIPDRLTGTLFVVNGWDGRISEERNRGSSVGFNLNYVEENKYVLNWNYLGGSESGGSGRRDLHELNAKVFLNEKWTLGLDLQQVTQHKVPGESTVSWYGAAAYAKALLTSSYSISTRYEYFDDSDAGFAIGGALLGPSAIRQRISAWTLTQSWDLGGGLETRFELRRDDSNRNTFFLKDDRTPTRSQESATVAILYSF